MRKEYDFGRARRRPSATRRKKMVTIRLDAETIAYFKALSDRTGTPYQTLINLFLHDCASRRLSPKWSPDVGGGRSSAGR
jgi:uncharacterized protein (DUF4415 family)